LGEFVAGSGAWFEAERRERPARSRWCKSTAMKE